MGKMVIKRLGDKFELTGGPLRFRTTKDLEDMCTQLQRFTRLKFYQDGVTPRLVDSMTIDDEQGL